MCRQVFGSQLEVAQPLACLDVEDVQDELQGVARVGGLHAAESHQILLTRAELYVLHLHVKKASFSYTEAADQDIQTMLVMIKTQCCLSHMTHKLHQIGGDLQVTTISANVIAKLSEAAAVRHLHAAFCFFEGQETASFITGARMGGTYILMAEPHESLEAGTSPDGHPLPVQGGNICAVRRELYEKLGPAIALVDRLRLASLCVVEEDFGLILVSNDELIPASPIHTPLMQVFLWRQEGISSFLQLIFVRDGRPQACEQSPSAGVCRRIISQERRQ